MIHTFYGFSQTPLAKDIPAQELLSTEAFAERSRLQALLRAPVHRHAAGFLGPAQQ